jgi:hypothetical protein
MPSPNASAQKARNCPAVAADPIGATSAGKVENELAM